MLDLAVWADNTGREGVARIRHTFFEKAVASPTVFHSRAAYNWQAKIVTLSEELRRRYRNTDRLHTREEVVEIVGEFLTKMATSGYGESTRMEVIRSATVKYYREILKSETGGDSYIGQGSRCRGLGPSKA